MDMDIGSETNTDTIARSDALEEDGFTEIFAQSQAAAEAAMNVRTPDDVLDEYFPAHRSSVSTVDTSRSSSHTPPTSIGIHIEAAADVSEIATLGTLDNERLLWDISGGSIQQSSTARQTATQAAPSLILPAFAELHLWIRICIFLMAAGLIVLVAYGLHGLSESIRLPATEMLREYMRKDASFYTTYFARLTHIPIWKAVLLSLNGGIWLCSVAFCGCSLWYMLAGTIDNRDIQARLLKLTLLWLVCSSIDGILRLRTREEITLSMMAIMLLMMTLSTFSKHIANPTAHETR